MPSSMRSPMRSRLLPKLMAAALVALIFGTVPVPARAGLFNPETFTLANGMKVVVIPDRRAPVVIHMVWYKVGAADEPVGKSGIAHLLEHLMFKGTDKVPAGEFSKIVARNGGRDNAFTSFDYTGYFQAVATDRLELVMKLEADRMSGLVLAPDEVERELQVVLEERRARTDNEPRALLSEQVAAVQYLAHPYGIPVIGWEHELRRLTRADALDFYRTYYAPNNAVLVVAGDITAAELRPLAEKYYGTIPSRPVPPRVRPQEPPQIAARRVEMKDARVRQPSWTRSYLAPSRTAGERQYAVPLAVLSDILGGGSTSRLYRTLVIDEKVAAGAGAHYGGVSLDLTRFYLFATPRPGGSVAEVEAATDRVIDAILRDGVTQKELDRAKTGLLAGAIYARDSLRTAARTFGAALTSGLTIDEIEAWPDLVAAVTVEDVNAAARYVFDLRRSVTGVLLPQPAS